MQIFAGFAGEGASNESGIVENGDFRFIRSLSSEHFTGLFTGLVLVQRPLQLAAKQCLLSLEVYGTQ